MSALFSSARLTASSSDRLRVPPAGTAVRACAADTVAAGGSCADGRHRRDEADDGQHGRKRPNPSSHVLRVLQACHWRSAPWARGDLTPRGAEWTIPGHPDPRASLGLTKGSRQKIRQFACFTRGQVPLGRKGKTTKGRAGCPARPSSRKRAAAGLVEGVPQAELDLVDVREAGRRLERLRHELVVDHAEPVRRPALRVDRRVREGLRRSPAAGRRPSRGSAGSRSSGSRRGTAASGVAPPRFLKRSCATLKSRRKTIGRRTPLRSAYSPRCWLR